MYINHHVGLQFGVIPHPNVSLQVNSSCHVFCHVPCHVITFDLRITISDWENAEPDMDPTGMSSEWMRAILYRTHTYSTHSDPRTKI